MELFQPTNGAQIPDGETACITATQVSLLNGGNETACNLGTATLTSHRLLWKSPGGGTESSLSLRHVVLAEAKSGGMFGKPKINLQLRNISRGPDFVWLQFGSGGRDRDAFLAQFHTVLRMKSWEAATVSASREPHRTGMAGFMQDMSAKTEARGSAVSNAFSDLDALMETANGMVTLAKRLKAVEATEEEDSEVTSMLENMGIANPVTRKSTVSVSDYHRNLAKELAHFFTVDQPLSGHGGMLELSDVYCVYNRARGTDLVSPNDLMAACKLLDSRTQLRLRRFDSGVYVLVSEAFGDQEVMDAVSKELKSGPYVTSVELGTKLGVSLVLATEYLQMAEARGCVARDESFEGTRFFLNIFVMDDAQLEEYEARLRRDLPADAEEQAGMSLTAPAPRESAPSIPAAPPVQAVKARIPPAQAQAPPAPPAPPAPASPAPPPASPAPPAPPAPPVSTQGTGTKRRDVPGESGRDPVPQELDSKCPEPKLNPVVPCVTPGADDSLPKVDHKVGWQCNICTYMHEQHEINFLACAMCGAPKGS